ncbi:MAG: hypothetical protein R3D02_06285 [Hyphomicrobiales bacterium]
MFLRTLAMLALTTMPAAAHETFVAHAHPHVDWGLAGAVLLIAAMAGAFLLGLRRSRRAEGDNDDPR